MGFGESVSTCFSKYATFSGRASRSEYWWFQLAILLSAITIIGPLILLLPAWAVKVRRFHDTGKSGWWLICYFIPFVGWFLFPLVDLVFTVLDSQPGDNQYGSNPKSKNSNVKKTTFRTEPKREAPPRQTPQQRPAMQNSINNNNYKSYSNNYSNGVKAEETVFVTSGQQTGAGPRIILNGRQYPLANGRNIIGRRGETSQATIQLDVDDMYMSRQHCLITISSNDNGRMEAKISNYKNKNKILVNSKFLNPDKEMVLPEVCDITLGHTTMKFSM